MKFLKAAVALVATMMIVVPTVTHADFMNDTITNSSLHYCNRTDDRPVITISEVCDTLFDGLNEIDDLCSQDGMQCKILPTRNVTIGTNTTVINDQINGKLEFLLGRLMKINELCEAEEEKLFNGEESLTELCNAMKCRTKLVIKNVTQYLLDEECGCDEGCDYTPGRFIEFNQDVTITQLLNILYGDFSFLFCIFFRIIQVSMSANPELTLCHDVNI